ncbi:MAG: NAD(P) transhydrogenase subunit alpha [Candidatus Hydrogenedens sp.]
MKKNVIKLNKIPLMGWISLVVFASILSLLLLGSFTKVKADSNAGTGMIPAITATECATEQTSPGTRALNPMTLLLFTFLIAVFLGVEILTKVPSQLHTPLMSGSNAISGITVVGACLAAGQGRDSVLLIGIGVIAMICAMINVAGGYLVTDRMLRMFKGKERK